MMNILLSIDDTDNLESRGTGELASLLAANVQQQGWGRSRYVTRHQLLVHPDIPYTSHNSAMCFAAEIEPAALDPLIAHASHFLATESAEGSDPGLCVAVIENLTDATALLDYGRRAKLEVLSKEGAYDLAARLGVHLSEHGGTGQGIIGALAGIGLRLGGNDGRLKGRLKLPADAEVVSVAQLLAHPWVDSVRTQDGEVVGEKEMVRFMDKVKTVLLDGESVLLVSAATDAEGGARWQTLSRKELKGY